ncbi:PAS domain-containing hybrid sensor histidine kinase/response regulator [Aliiglaciecola sp. CAU 1673]|uniref:hybrid sensor histidine kinase/response regulator n=1 Tax=Aliiglaciecola sp. CAU 1673 TaxID=3032595 RepID=UPI0023DB4456|nr:PAS domain-containing hybrid sensor histidine kinase/response regulator [Aliiglaciecola sp. CAU 1673]MDF2180009.1 PAS domain-containing hybrid sensor histidine kinase/response regulator [Aliiglaciecola sp. CAU 1673]
MTIFWVLAALAYIALLFYIAQRGDKQGSRANALARHPAIYSMALAIYCTSWTYYGAVGQAAKSQWQYLPILLGPALLFVFGFGLLRKMLEVSKRQNITSISDFIASRYGKRRSIAMLVTLLMTLAIIPYIALQLKAVDTSLQVFAQLEGGGGFKALFATLLMALFAVIFGTRHADITQYRSGLMLAIAVESLVKLLGLCCAALFAYTLLSNDVTVPAKVMLEPWQNWSGSGFDFAVVSLMAAGAIFCLPRQFHVMIVDNHHPSHLATARWLFPLYLLLISLAIVPVAVGGNALFGQMGTDQDTFLMQLAGLKPWLSLLVFLGGISAATAMIVVSSLALGTMLTNDVLVPLLIRRQPRAWLTEPGHQDKLLRLRRLVIFLILILAYGYYTGWANQSALASMGLLAFSLVVQLVPAILGGLYWRQGHASGVLAGLAVGFGCWVLFILFPLIQLPNSGDNTSIITQGVVISVLANFGAYVLFSISAGHSLLDRIQATSFVRPQASVQPASSLTPDSQLKVGDLQALLSTFVGQRRTEQLLADFIQEHGTPLASHALPSDAFIQFCERSLAGVVGGSSARSLISVLVQGKQLDVEEVFSFFEDTTEALKTHQAILFSSIENLPQGISVINKDLELVAWNRSYLQLFDYPTGLVKVGQPVEKLVRFNAERGECGPGKVEELVQKRLQYMQQGSAHRFIRRRSDGRVIEMIGNPLPDGGFVTSFTDITEHVEIQKALEEANINLERRIDHRTQQIREINEELKLAKQTAEQANQSKSRFLALASHDILQPLNAARLYLSSLDEEELSSHNKEILHKLGSSLTSSEQLISTLLEIAKLEQGAMTPSAQDFPLTDILQPLMQEARVLADRNQVRFEVKSKDLMVHSDATYLRRILQNLISNAVKYSPGKRVLVCCRARGDKVLIQVWDQGMGIATADQSRIFSDFYRAHRGDIQGLGLGLSVVKKMSEQLGHPLTLRSELGKGSCFSVWVPLGQSTAKPQALVSAPQSSQLDTSEIWCVDDDPTNLDALKSLLQKWQCQPRLFSNGPQASDKAKSIKPPQAMIVDYQLNGDEADGLALIQQLRQQWNKKIPALLVTAVKEEGLKARARSIGVDFLAKPIKPGALKAWLEQKIRR